MVLYLNYKTEYFFHGLKTEIDRLHGVLAVSFIVANYMTFLTENTLYYCKLTMMMSLLVTQGCVYEQVYGGRKWAGCIFVFFSIALTAGERKR